MADLKESGAVDLIGIGVNETEVCEYLLERVDLDVVLLAGRYTLLDQRAAERVLPLCRKKAVRFIAAAPYNSGILAQPTARLSDPHFDYGPPSAELLGRTRELERVCHRFGVPLAAAALHFPARHPDISSVLAGFSRESEVADHLARLRTAVPEELWAALRDGGLVRAPISGCDGIAA